MTTNLATKPVQRKAFTAKVIQDETTTLSDLHQRIEQKAYELFTKRGCAHGNDILDWNLAQDLIELERKAASFKQFQGGAVDPQELRGEIEKRAYQLFEYRGRAHGNDVFDWSLAEEIAFLKNNIR